MDNGPVVGLFPYISDLMHPCVQAFDHEYVLDDP